MRKGFTKGLAVLLAGLMLTGTAACGKKQNDAVNLAEGAEQAERVVNLFGPTEKSNPDVANIARTAQELTVLMAEEQLGVRVEYRTYTAEDYQDKTYDDVTLARARSDMDDFYLLNPDTIQVLGMEDKLADLSVLESAANLREVVKVANTVNGKLVAIPQEVVVYGLFVNKDLFDKYELELPNTPDEFLECCRVFKENGIETPVGANRWWLENFVLSQAYADMYNGGNTETEIAALNSGEAKYSSYMRSGFEFLKTLIDLEYVDAEKAYTSEAIEGEGPDFLAQKTPIVMAYWGAANSETAYGKPDFNLQVIGFPTERGQMPVVSLSGYGVCANAEHLEDTLAVMDVILSDEALQLYAENNKVISPSKNVEVECIDALKPLNNLVEDGVFVLGSNANLKVEQWGNLCLTVRKLLEGASVEECLEEFDRLQEESLGE